MAWKHPFAAQVFFQIVANVPTGFPRLVPPSNLERFYDKISAFNLDFVQMIGATCVGRYDYLDTLTVMTAVPVGGLAALFVGYQVTKRALPRDRKQAVKNALSMVALVVTFLVFTACSKVVIRTLMCDSDFGAPSEAAHSPYYGASYLIADYSVDCHSARYKVHREYAMLMLFVYPLGVPLRVGHG